MSKDDLDVAVREILNKFDLPNLAIEAELWRRHCASREPDTTVRICAAIQMARSFFPAVSDALTIAATLPVTTCTVERSFSTLRRIKTWLRSTMSSNRLNGLAMMSVHQRFVYSQSLSSFARSVVNKFARRAPRRLEF